MSCDRHSIIVSVICLLPAEEQASQPSRLHLHDRRVLHQHQERAGAAHLRRAEDRAGEAAQVGAGRVWSRRTGWGNRCEGPSHLYKLRGSCGRGAVGACCSFSRRKPAVAGGGESSRPRFPRPPMGLWLSCRQGWCTGAVAGRVCRLGSGGTGLVRGSEQAASRHAWETRSGHRLSPPAPLGTSTLSGKRCLGWGPLPPGPRSAGGQRSDWPGRSSFVCIRDNIPEGGLEGGWACGWGEAV